MAVSDLTGYTWVGNESIIWEYSGNIFSYSLNFNSNNSQFNSITINDDDCIIMYGSTRVFYKYNSNPWENNAYKTITITGGTDATNQTLIAWLEANGTLTAPQSTPSTTNNIFFGTSAINKVYFGTSEVSKIYYGNTLIYEMGEEHEPTANPYLTFSSPSSFTLNVVDNQKYWDGTLEYSTDTITWNTWSGTTTLSSVSDGTKHNLYLRGTGNIYITGSIASTTKAYWVLTGSNISCDGNIENLLDYQTVANSSHPYMDNYCYSYMFNNCTSLTSAPQLPATDLQEGCYQFMFRNCTSLTTAPELPATTLDQSCYLGMFNGCTSLTTAPALPATTLNLMCYGAMFVGCSSLTTLPEIPATIFDNQCCYYMFFGCTNIKLSETQTGEYQTAYRIPKTGTGTVYTGSLTDMFTNTGGTFTGTPSVNTTYYTSNTIIPASGNNN